jgi:hypothetical protein
MSLQMPSSELEQRRQLNDQALSDVATGGVTEMAGNPVQLAGKIPSSVVDQLLSIFKGPVAKNTPEGTVDVKPRVPAEGGLVPDDARYRDTQKSSATGTLSDEGLDKFEAQGQQATDLSPSGQRMAEALDAADEEALTPDEELQTIVTASQRGVTADNQGFNLTEDSSGLATESQADEVLEVATIAEGYLRSMKDGAPFNWDKIRTTDDVKGLIQAVSDSLPEAETAATRGVVSNVDTVEAATGQLADALGMTGSLKRKLLKRQRGEGFINAEEAVAARMLLADSAKALAKLAADVQAGVGGDRTMLLFRRQLAIHNGIQLQIKGAQAEAGRLLQSFNIPVTDGMTPDAAALMNMDTIEASGGAKSLKMAAEGLLAAAANGEAAFNKAAQKGIMTKFRQGMEHLYINGLLSGPKTQFKNLGGNLLFMTMQVPEEFIAGMIGTVERGAMRAVGAEIDYTKQAYMSDVTARLTGYFMSFNDALAAAAIAVKTGMPGDAVNKAEMNTYRSAAGNGNTAFGRAMSYLYTGTSLPTRLLLGGDDLFKVLSQNGELHAIANRQKKAALAAGMSPAEAEQERLMVLLSPRQFAKELDIKGRYDTLMTDLGEFGKASSALQNTWFGRYVLPFATAPTNDILRTLERTPIGLAHPDIYGADAGKRQIKLARLAFGGIAMSQIAMYAGMGHITGATPKDKKIREKLPPGWQPYSFVFRGEGFPEDMPLFDRYGNANGPLEYVSYSGMGPAASMIGITAGAVQKMTLARNAEERQSIAAAAVFATTDYFRELPMLQGVAEILTALERGDANYITRGPLGSMNLGVPVPNPYSALTRTVERIGDNTVTKTGAPFDIYTVDDVRRLTEDGTLKPGPDGNFDWRLVGLPKGDAGDQFFQAVHDGYLKMVATSVFQDEEYAEIPRYDTLGRLVTDGPTYEEAPYLRLWNAFSPIVISGSEEQEPFVKELVRLDWPLPQPPKNYKGVVLTEMQISNFMWLAKGNREQVPPNLEGMNLVPVRVRGKAGSQTFQASLASLMNSREYRNSTDKEKRSLFNQLDDEFMAAAWSRLTAIPGNERLGIAARQIEGLKERGYR